MHPALARALCLLAFSVSLALGAAPKGHDLVVAKNGSGDFTTVQAAVNALSKKPAGKQIILIKPGVYREKVVVSVPEVTLVGLSADRTEITYDDDLTSLDPAGHPVSTGGSATFRVYGRHFTAYNLTFSNASKSRLQAVAVWAESDQGRFFGCRFVGYQDTLYVARRKQYFKGCYIAGAVDFIFGSATAVFDRCTVHCTGPGFVTAANTPPNKKYGLVFRHCALTGAAPARSVYLGRPWAASARVAYLGCTMGAHIHPDGWDNWADPDLEDTAYFAEYGNAGDGADLDDRVDWARRLSDEEAAEYSLKHIFKIPAGERRTEALWYKDS